MIAYLRRLANEATDARFERFDDVVPAIYDYIQWTTEGVPSCHGNSLADCDVFYFRAVGNAYATVGRLVKYALDNGIAIVDDYLKEQVGPRSKSYMHAVLAENEIPQPRFSSFHGLNSVWDYIPKRCMFNNQFPVVLKFAKGGRRGIGTFLISDPHDIDRVYAVLSDRYHNNEKGHANMGDWPFVLQEYIPNEGDYRAIVVGGECLGVVKRGRKSINDLIMNSSDHGARKYKNDRWPRSVGKLAVDAANAMRVDVAGVDIVRHEKTRELYVIEVNEAPSFTVFERQTGIDVAEEIVTWLRSIR